MNCLNCHKTLSLNTGIYCIDCISQIHDLIKLDNKDLLICKNCITYSNDNKLCENCDSSTTIRYWNGMNKSDIILIINSTRTLFTENII